MLPYNKWAPRALQVSEFIAPNSSVLDIGGGNGQLSLFLDNPKKYIVMDIAHNALAKKLATEFIKADVQVRLPTITDKIDVITCLGLLEYLKDVKEFLSGIKKYSNKLIFTYFERSEKLATWKNNYKFREIKTIAEEAGWEVKVVKQVYNQPQKIFICRKKS